MAEPSDRAASDSGLNAGSDTGPIPIEPEPGKGRLDEPGLLEDFDEDADFDKDPELERAVTGGLPPAPPARLIDDRPIFVKAGWDDPRVTAGFGGGRTLSVGANEVGLLLRLYGVYTAEGQLGGGATLTWAPIVLPM